jgi:hypothetical protein
MDDKQQVLVYAKDLEKMAALIDDLAWEINRVGNSGINWFTGGSLTYNNLALSMEELMVEYPDGCIIDGSKKPEVFWTEKRKLARNEKRND